MKAIYPWRLKIGVLIVICVSYVTTNAQTVIKTSDNFGAGHTEYIWNAYTGSGEVTNSYEFVPFGYNANDLTVKYPIIFFFPGAGDLKTSDPQSVKFLGIRAIAIILEGGLYSAGTFNFLVIGMQGAPGSSIEDYASFMENYVFNKYRNKIDFSRVYLTGLSLGGGKIMEYMENPARASKIAAIAPVATGTSCPYIANCGYGNAYNAIINNVASNTSVGVFFTHNFLDKTVSYEVSKGFADGINALQPGKAQYYYDPVTEGHDAWSRAYDPGKTRFGNKNMYDWFLQFSLNMILPVKLLSFKAESAGRGTNKLNWITAEESNSNFFAIERSANGKDYIEIGRVAAAGNSSTQKNYSFTDAQPIEGVNYYRLKQVDKNNKFEYSAVKKLILSNRGLDFQVGPNPFTTQLDLLVTGDTKTPLTADIVDVNGRLLSQTRLAKTTSQLKKNIDLSTIASGVYILRITGENVLYTQKLIKN